MRQVIVGTFPVFIMSSLLSHYQRCLLTMHASVGITSDRHKFLSQIRLFKCLSGCRLIRGLVGFNVCGIVVASFMGAVAGAEGQFHSISQHCAEHYLWSAYEAAKSAYQEYSSINGVIAWNDILALGALLYVLEQGKRVLEDVEII